MSSALYQFQMRYRRINSEDSFCTRTWSLMEKVFAMPLLQYQKLLPYRQKLFVRDSCFWDSSRVFRWDLARVNMAAGSRAWCSRVFRGPQRCANSRRPLSGSHAASVVSLGRDQRGTRSSLWYRGRQIIRSTFVQRMGSLRPQCRRFWNRLA